MRGKIHAYTINQKQTAKQHSHQIQYSNQQSRRVAASRNERMNKAQTAVQHNAATSRTNGILAHHRGTDEQGQRKTKDGLETGEFLGRGLTRDRASCGRGTASWRTTTHCAAQNQAYEKQHTQQQGN